ncbi:MAG: tyrosine-type recombinase/integrase [Microcystaceae cyanobacterium]
MLATTAPAQLQKAELFNQFAEFIRLDVASGDASADTVKTYASNVKQFFTWCQANRLHPLEATREDLKEYRRWLVEVKKYKSATIGLKLTVVRRFYAGAVEQGLVLANPALGIKPPRETRDPAERINYLEEPEAAQLLEALPQDSSVKSLRDRLLMGVMLLEGCRTVEMHRLSVKDIVRRGSDIGLKVEGKRNKRVVPLTPDLGKLLRKYLKARQEEGEEVTPEAPLLISVAYGTKGKRLSRRSIQRVVDKYLHQTQLKRTEGRTLSAHSLRHTAGTFALRAGSQLRQVQDLLGHADPRTTALYAHIADRWRNNPALRLRVTVRV